jgi:hypothetical protein
MHSSERRSSGLRHKIHHSTKGIRYANTSFACWKLGRVGMVNTRTNRSNPSQSDPFTIEERASRALQRICKLLTRYVESRAARSPHQMRVSTMQIINSIQRFISQTSSVKGQMPSQHPVEKEASRNTKKIVYARCSNRVDVRPIVNTRTRKVGRRFHHANLCRVNSR